MNTDIQLIGNGPPPPLVPQDISAFIDSAHTALALAKGAAETWAVRKDAEAVKEAAKVLKRKDLEIALAEVTARAEMKILSQNPPQSHGPGRGKNP